jgi:hypothetical protein
MPIYPKSIPKAFFEGLVCARPTRMVTIPCEYRKQYIAAYADERKKESREQPNLH